MEENAEIPEEHEGVEAEEAIQEIKMKEVKNLELHKRASEQEEEKVAPNPEENKEAQKEKEPEGKLLKQCDGIFTKSLAEIIKELWVSKSKSLSPDSFYHLFTEIVPHFRGYS